MSTEGFKRKLTAILSADVAGYSRLMGEDEALTVKTITAYREVMGALIKQHRGRVIDSPGDNLLAEFASVVDAVQCAVAVQKEFHTRNAELPENRRMVFRIGINLGDVIEEEGRIYGDGVNIAARLESLADPGGICVSKTAFDHIETKLPLGYEYLGEQEVKNIAKPVGAYKVLMEPRVTTAEKIEKEKALPVWRRKAILAGGVAFVVVVIAAVIWNFYFRPPPIEPASVEKMAYPLPDKPSIAVLPFVNMSEDPKQEYFSDGITEEIITGLSKSPYLFVIARQSTFAYKGKPVKVKQISEELGVRYVLEGSVRRSGKKVRITAQFIDALTGHHLWAERYDRDLKDIFALQDEITMKIMTALHVKLEVGEQARVLQRGARNLEAFLKAMEGRDHIYRYNKEDNAMAKKLFKEVIALDPDWAMGYWGLSRTLFWDVYLGTSKSPKESMAKAFELLKKANAMDESNASVHVGLGVLFTQIRQYDKAVFHVERALALEPNLPEVLHHAASTLCFAGRPEEAIGLINKAMRLDPVSQAQYFVILSLANRMTGRYDEAMKQAKRAVERDPENQFGYISLAGASILAGHEEEARAASEKVLKINPKFTLKKYARTLKYKDQFQIDLYIDALRRAGLPETPPLPLPDKPSVAVLPFVNMSGDPEQEYFGDGITEEIITALSKTPKLFVIARTSSSKYKGKEVDVRTVGRELGVKYVLEGSVRKAEDKVRITAQLVDAQTGHHLWAERYDRDLKDIFAVQDDITMKITTSLHVKLTEGEQARMWGQRAKSLDVFLKVLKARWFMAQGTTESHERLGQVAQEIINMAPEIDVGYNWLGLYYWLRFVSFTSPQESLMKAYQLGKRALSMDESNAANYRLLGNVYLFMRQYDEAIAAGKRSVALEPSSAASHGVLGLTLSYAGDPDEAIISLKQGVRLNPFPPYWYFVCLGRCYIRKGQYDKALVEYNKAQELAPDNFLAFGGKVVALSLLGREQEARAAARKFSEINPYFSVDMFASVVPVRDSAYIKKITDAMRKAGLK